MSQTVGELVQDLLQVFMNKDLEASLAYFTDDAEVYDPHYPVPKMVGKAAIRQGLEWGLGNMEKPGFIIRHMWTDDTSAVVEMDTHHVFKGGMEVKFDQVFICELRDGKIAKFHAYVPYPPGGIGGLLSKVTRLIWKLKGKA
ncbi:MAG: nuclear transport factor 2 family protein [Anaerolineae bacterium]|nr:nuclear transport factor 2 family protein [Anaerolineae bacterium]